LNVKLKIAHVIMDTAHMMDSNLLMPITKLHIILFILFYTLAYNNSDK